MPKPRSNKPVRRIFNPQHEYVDHRGILRTFPKKMAGNESLIKARLAKVEAAKKAAAEAVERVKQKPKKGSMPGTMKTIDVKRILLAAGFRNVHGAPNKFFHPEHGTVTLNANYVADKRTIHLAWKLKQG